MIRRLTMSAALVFVFCHVGGTAWSDPQPQAEGVTSDPRNALVVEIVSTPSGSVFKYNGKELSREVLLAKLERLKNTDKEGRLWVRLQVGAGKAGTITQDMKTSLQDAGFKTVVVETTPVREVDTP